MGCIFDEPLEPYLCEADWNCKDCPNWIDEKEPQEISDRNMKMWEGIFKAEKAIKNDTFKIQRNRKDTKRS